MARFCSIEPDDDKGFWHVNFFDVPDPRDLIDAVPDAFATTKVDASLDEAICLAREAFNPSSITVWTKCPYCGGSGVRGDTEADWDECDECDDGLVAQSC